MLTAGGWVAGWVAGWLGGWSTSDHSGQLKANQNTKSEDIWRQGLIDDLLNSRYGSHHRTIRYRRNTDLSLNTVFLLFLEAHFLPKERKFV